jgi:hypothetical protein
MGRLSNNATFIKKGSRLCGLQLICDVSIGSNRFSKKWENHEAELALWFAYYDFGRKHMTLKETLAMASGLENHVWTIRQLIDESAKF